MIFLDENLHRSLRPISSAPAAPPRPESANSRGSRSVRARLVRPPLGLHGDWRSALVPARDACRAARDRSVVARDCRGHLLQLAPVPLALDPAEPRRCQRSPPRIAQAPATVALIT